MPRRVKFGGFEVDMRSGELTRQGKRLPLQEQPFRLLALLLERPGELVTREEVRQKLWPHAVVDFDHGVNKAVSKIRDVLGDSADKPRFVETVARHGYRFLADVNASIHSIAVLPLENLSGDPAQEYFADGMTDELITQLGQIKALRVISRTSVMNYKKPHKSLPEISRDLNVDAVVEGSVLRAGDRVRITAQLIRVPADTHLWAHSYEGNFSDTLTLQSEVAQAIAAQILTTLTSAERHALAKVKTVRPEAYEAYLRGRYFWNKRDAPGLTKAIDYFQRAIAMDPNYAQAYSGLADAYALAGAWEYGVLAPGDAAPRAKAAATRAVQLDPMSSEAHTSLAFALEQYPWDWVAAGHEFRRALELNPGYAIAHDWYGYHLITIGRVADGIAELRTAENLDPLSLIISAGLADALFIAHRYDEAMRQLHKTLELDPNYAIAHNHVGEVLIQQGNATASIPEFQRAIEVSGHNWAFDANLAYAYALSGRSEDAQAIVDDLTLQHHDNGNVAANIALAYMGFGNADLTMHWLDVAYDTRFEPVILVRPQFDNLRSDPRFQGLMRRVGLEPAAHAR